MNVAVKHAPGRDTSRVCALILRTRRDQLQVGGREPITGAPACTRFRVAVLEGDAERFTHWFREVAGGDCVAFAPLGSLDFAAIGPGWPVGMAGEVIELNYSDYLEAWLSNQAAAHRAALHESYLTARRRLGLSESS